MTEAIRLRFLGEEREFTVHRYSRCLWVCLVGGGKAKLCDDSDFGVTRWRLECADRTAYGPDPQSAATALEEALRPLAGVLACLVDARTPIHVASYTAIAEDYEAARAAWSPDERAAWDARYNDDGSPKAGVWRDPPKEK
jgi:hypothetical protein